MKHGEISPESNPLFVLAEKKAEEYLAKQDAATRQRYEAAMKKLGLKPGASMWEYLCWFTGRPQDTPQPTDLSSMEELDEEVAKGINDFFEMVENVLAPPPPPNSDE